MSAAETSIACRREDLTAQLAALLDAPLGRRKASARAAQVARLERRILELDQCHPRRRSAKKGPIPVSGWPDLITAAEARPVRAEIVSVDQVITSHLPETWQVDPRYPAGTQERRYDADPVEQHKVQQIARGLDPRLLLARTPSPLDGPPIVARLGGQLVALGGNGRTMGLKLAYARGAADLYEGALRQVTRRALPAFPVLVRVVEIDPSDAARWSRELNRPLGAGLDRTAQAVSLARSLPSSVPRLLAGRDLSTALRSAVGREVLAELQRARLVGAGERALYEEEGLSEQGRDLVRRALAGAVLSADEIDATAPQLVDQVARAAPSLLVAAEIAGPSWDLRPAIRAAARDHRDATTYQGGLERWLADPHLVSPETLGQRGGPEVLRALAARTLPDLALAYLEAARANPQGQARLFGEPDDPVEVLRRGVARS